MKGHVPVMTNENKMAGSKSTGVFVYTPCMERRNGNMKAGYCGSFDPPTLGHLDVIERAAGMFGSLVVFISCNSAKTPMFSDGQRLAWLQEMTKDMPNVQVCIQTGLSVKACADAGCQVMVRGIRSGMDFEYEQNIEAINRLMDPHLETVLLMARAEYMFCSSSNVRELLKYHQDVSRLVPACVLKDLQY